MKKVYVLLEWYYEGDSNLVNCFLGAYLTYEEALENAKKVSYRYDNNNVKHEVPLEFITFVNYKTKETSDVYIEGYDPVEYGSYNSGNKKEIREIIFKDYSDWNIENPESIKCCEKCNLPVGQAVTSKANPTTGYYICLCGWDVSNVKKI